LRYTETGSWKDAFFGAIPKRKQLQQSTTSADDKQPHDSIEEPRHSTVASWNNCHAVAH